jgi:phosphatidylglycerol lysyltransferase
MQRGANRNRGEEAVSGAVQNASFAGLLEHGWNATSFQTLEPGLAYFSEERGFVAYFDTGSAWVAAGAPVTSTADLPDLCQRFVHAAKRAGRRVRFFGIEERMLALCPDLHAIPIGAQPVWAPTHWEQTLAAAPGLRAQIRRARAKGVRVRQASPQEIEGPLQPAIRLLIERWHSLQGMPPMGFLVELELAVRIAERRFFVADRSERVIGLLALVPVYARSGWLFEDLVRDPEAPNGTMELMVDVAMRALAQEDCPYATLGLAPLAGEVSPWLTIAGRLGRSLFDFAGLQAFRRRLHPQAWARIYLAYPQGECEFVPVLDSLSAFTRGRPFRFLVRTLLRAPAVLLHVLWVLLVPWTTLVALAPRGWFPHEAIRWLWIGFDVAMTLGLRALAKHWSTRLARLLAISATADMLLTAAQFILFNARRLEGALQFVCAVAAMAAPTFATGVLWGALVERSVTGERHS